MPDIITITGLVASDPRHIVTSEGLSITTFRLASQQRRFDRSQERWIDAETNWYTVTTFRRLAINAATSIKKGERVLVTGKLRIREWENSQRAGITADIEAEAVGHDIGWGTSTFARSIVSSSASRTSGQNPAAPENAVAPNETWSTDETAAPFDAPSDSAGPERDLEEAEASGDTEPYRSAQPESADLPF